MLLNKFDDMTIHVMSDLSGKCKCPISNIYSFTHLYYNNWAASNQCQCQYGHSHNIIL